MYIDFKILSKNNIDELIFYKMIEKNERKNTIHLPSEKEKKKKKSKIIDEKELIPYL